jgi:hypothetical protein
VEEEVMIGPLFFFLVRRALDSAIDVDVGSPRRNFLIPPEIAILRQDRGRKKIPTCPNKRRRRRR